MRLHSPYVAGPSLWMRNGMTTRPVTMLTRTPAVLTAMLQALRARLIAEVAACDRRPQERPLRLWMNADTRRTWPSTSADARQPRRSSQCDGACRAAVRRMTQIYDN